MRAVMYSSRTKFTLLFLILSSFIFSPLKTNAEDIIIYVTNNVYIDYLQLVKNRDITTITNFSGTGARRDVIDMIIVQQALKFGGFKHNFIFLPSTHNFRNTELLVKGQELLSFDSFWLNDANHISKDVYVSNSVIRKGEYNAGIYTSPNNKKVLDIKNLNDLKSFTAVSTPNWKTDWQTLSALPLKRLIREDDWINMASMVSAQQVDLFLMPFHSSDDGSFHLRDIHLKPVKNIAIELHDSRHFIISKKHPLGYKAYRAINIGLQQLRKQKTITRAYKEAGFFIDKSQFKVLNSS